MSTVALPTLVQHLRHQRLIIDYMFVSAAAMFIFDYLLMLHLEIKLIWFSRWNYTKFLFLAIRYMPFIEIALALHDQLIPDVSAEKCKVLYPAESWLSIIHSFFVECILLLRTWAIWNRNKSLGIGFVALLLAFIVLQCVLGVDSINSIKYASPPYPGFRGCLITNSNRALWGIHASVMIVDAVVFILMAISAYLSYQHGNIGKFSFIIYRDVIVAANVAATIALPLDMILLLTPLQYMLQSVLTARIVLNIRGAGNRSMQTELHTCYSDPPPIAIPLHTSCMEDLASCDSIR